MDDKVNPSPLFDGIANWLIREGLSDVSLPDIIRGFGQRLVSGGVPIHRIGVGGLLLHPVFGALDIVWEARSNLLSDHIVPREAMRST